jgi:hypothetical protein
MNLLTYLGKQILGVLAAYKQDDIVIHIVAVYPQCDNRLKVFFPHGHSFIPGDRVTLHLDNRSGVDEFDAEIRVYRASYKGEVLDCDGDWLTLDARECQLLHGFHAAVSIKAPGYRYPDDPRPGLALAASPLATLPPIESYDQPNKVGVLVTMAQEQPHTTVLAFLSTENDDIFLITFPETFKSQLLKRDPHCFFVLDERASFTFERAIEWNYTIVEGVATRIASGTPLFLQVQQAFIDKNPWEMPFFIRPDVEMYHICCQRLVCPGKRRRAGIASV